MGTANWKTAKMSRNESQSGIQNVRKSKRSDPLEDNRQLMKYAKASSRAARRKALKAGLPVVYVKNGELVQETPDHQINVLERAAVNETFDLREYLCQG